MSWSLPASRAATTIKSANPRALSRVREFALSIVVGAYAQNDHDELRLPTRLASNIFLRMQESDFVP